MTRGLLCSAILVLAGAALPQETAPASRPDDADALLAQVDARVYSAERAGMTSVEFSYRPPSSGPVGLPQFRIRARWSAGGTESVEFLQADGGAPIELPDSFRRESSTGGPSAQESFDRGARSLVGMFRGVPYSTRFKAWRKRIETRMVNAREERTIVCEPAVAGQFRRVEISLDRRGLPWRIVSFLSRPEPPVDRIIDEPTWGEFDGKLLMTAFKKTRGAATEQIVVRFQRQDGFIVPASYERLEGAKPPTRVVFEGVRVAGAVPGAQPQVSPKAAPTESR